jgi:signal transduction histidine kinase
VPILNESDEIVEWFSAALDVTAHRNAEAALRQADRRKDEFLATLAHELRNPLAPLRNGLQIARLSSPADAPFRRTIEMMDRQVNMLVHLVEDLMDISRIATGKIELRRERVTLHEVLAAGAEASRAAIDARGHNLIIEPSALELTVEGDFYRLTQVFSNLLSNAAKYTDAGGTIELRVTREGREGVVSVADTGIGIPAADLPCVFEMFSQVGSHRQHADGGLGDAATSLAMLLEQLGHEVVIASDGQDGITKAATFRPHIAFLDLGMPRMDGVEAAKQLRTLPDWGGQTIIDRADGMGQDHDLQRTREAGFDHHVLKPVDLHSIEGLFSARIA